MYVYKNRKGRMNQPESLPAKYLPFTIQERIKMGWYPVEIIPSKATGDKVITGYTLTALKAKVTAQPITREKTAEEISIEIEKQEKIKANADYSELKEIMKGKGVTMDDLLLRIELIEKIMGL